MSRTTSTTSKTAGSAPVEVDVSNIKIPEEWRETDSFVVQELARSFKEHGQLNPIVLNKDYTLIAGMHRFLAAQRLGWLTIQARFCDGSELEEELLTLDENLVRAELCPLDRCLASARSKEIYEILHPETKRGGKRPEAVAEEVDCFGRRTARLRGVSDRTIRREVAVGKALAHMPRELLKWETMAALEQLTRFPLEEQENILGLMEQHNDMELAEACSMHEFYRDRGNGCEPEPVEVRSSPRTTTAAKPPDEIVESSPWGDFTSLTSAWPQRSEGGDGVRDRPSSQRAASLLLERVEAVVECLAEIADGLPVETPDAAAKLLDEVLSYFRNEINRRFDQPVDDEVDSEVEEDAEDDAESRKEGQLAGTP